MSGKHHSLADDCTSVVPDLIQEPFRHMLECILQYQYVCDFNSKSMHHMPPIHKVEVGSGMGLIASGDISDASLHVKLEAPLMLNSRVRAQHSIKWYGRFKDDILMVIGGDLQNVQLLFEKMKRCSDFFKLKVDSLSKESVVMLDVVLSKSTDSELN